MPILPKGTLFRKLEAAEPYLVPAIVVLVGLGAFGLGRLSATPMTRQSLRILYPAAQAAEPTANTAAVGNAKAGETPSAPASQGTYVGSKTGTKYYLSSCSGASRIKDTNKVYFATLEAAKAAGYSPAANCQGL